jgi:TolB-like protein
MTDVFVSYASEDRVRAQAIVQALEDEGFNVWWDRQIPLGRSFHKTIQDTIENSKCVLVLWSKHSIESEWVWAEAAEGLRRKILVPVLVDSVLPPLIFRGTQCASLVNWPKDQGEIHKTIEAIREHVSGGNIPENISKSVAHASGQRDWKLRISMGLICVIGVALVIAAAMYFARKTSDVQQSSLTAKNPVIVVEGPRNLSGEEANDWLTEGLAILIRESLSHSRYLDVVSSSYWKSIVETIGNAKDSRPFKLAREQGITHIFSGELMKHPEGLLFTYRLITVENGRHIYTGRLIGRTSEDLLENIQEVATVAKQVLRVPHREQVGSFAADFATTNPSAYEAYVNGLEFFLRFELEDAKSAFSLALGLAPEFYIVRYRLAFLEWVTGNRRAASEHLSKIPEKLNSLLERECTLMRHRHSS